MSSSQVHETSNFTYALCCIIYASRIFAQHSSGDGRFITSEAIHGPSSTKHHKYRPRTEQNAPERQDEVITISVSDHVQKVPWPVVDDDQHFNVGSASDSGFGEV